MKISKNADAFYIQSDEKDKKTHKKIEKTSENIQNRSGKRKGGKL